MPGAVFHGTRYGRWRRRGREEDRRQSHYEASTSLRCPVAPEDSPARGRRHDGPHRHSSGSLIADGQSVEVIPDRLLGASIPLGIEEAHAASLM